MAQDKTDKSGLRFISKTPGTNFSGVTTGGKVMSCFRCGLHKVRVEGSTVRILGVSRFVCGDCRPPKSAAVAAAAKPDA